MAEAEQLLRDQGVRRMHLIASRAGGETAESFWVSARYEPTDQVRFVKTFGYGLGVALRRTDRRRRRSETLDVHVVELLPAVVPFAGPAVEHEVEAIEAVVPSGRVARGLAQLFQRVGEGEHGSLGGGFELEAQQILAPEELQHPRRVARDHGAVESGTLAVAELEPQRGPVGRARR